ncbi:flavoprotein [Thermoactinospora rubra]|uniref:flavoprotein n=1 Tax=Thermoactinospora rubra TaxID=1088767 RepID=UPI000A1083E3|nr:flavoprotein [Thermoactinospora rubra]
MSATGPDPAAADPATATHKLLIGACGAADVMSLPNYLLALRTRMPALRVRVIMTATAVKFLPARTVRLIGEAVFCEGEDNFDPGHAKLAQWADHFIVLPATANVLAQAAQGFSGSLLTAALLAYPGRAIFFPCMNAEMWHKPAVQRNVAQLTADGHHIAGPVMAQCWEISTAEYKTGPCLPSPSQVAGIVEDVVRHRGTRS